MQKIYILLGYAGLIPFVGLAALILYGVNTADYLLLSYSALILSFLGGVVWMAALQSSKHWTLVLFSNLLMLTAWLTLIFPDSSWSMPVLACLYLLLLWTENQYLRNYYFPEFFNLRRNLTLIAAFSLFTSATFT